MYSRNLYGRGSAERSVIPPPDYGGTAWAEKAEIEPQRSENNSASAGTELDECAAARSDAVFSDSFRSGATHARPVMGEMAENDGFTRGFGFADSKSVRHGPQTKDENTGVKGIAEDLGKRRFDAEDLILVSLLMALLGEEGDGMTPLLLALLLA